ncbi:MAG: hypothetical protein JWQ02_1874 [Capsulimonas sp.]|nr:hypothetical protein [Capsulimonas sp.]
MREIKQDDDDGCGLACVAMVANTTYAAVLETYRDVCGADLDDKVEPTRLPALKEIMRRHGVTIEGRGRWIGKRQPADLDLDCPALFKMNPRAGGKWHWAIWDHRSSRLLDPKVPSYKKKKFISYWKLRPAIMPN